MDRLGRRPLLLVPMVLMVLILALITIALKLQVNFAYVSDVVFCFTFFMQTPSITILYGVLVYTVNYYCPSSLSIHLLFVL